jgi:hypothetical protein
MKTKMVPFKSVVASALVGLQLTGFAFADVGASNKTDDLQEQVLIANLVSLTAQKISEKDFQSKVLPVVNAYEQASPIEGRSDRFAQAMVEMNMMTPARADEVKASIDASVGAQLNANPNMNQDQRNQLVMDATLQQMNFSSAGAQFSGTCWGLTGGAAAIIIGSVFANVYASTLTHSTSQTTASGSQQGSGTSTTSTQGTSSSTTTTTVAGTTTTSSSSVTSNETEKKLLITGAAIGYGIAATMFIMVLADADSLCD